MPLSFPRQEEQVWKILLALISLLFAVLIWWMGLMSSLNRPSVAPTLSLQQQELTLLAEPAVPVDLRPLLVGQDPRDVILQALRNSPEEQRDARQQHLLALLEAAPVGAPELWLDSSDDPLVARLECEARGGSEDRCYDATSAQAAALRLALSVLLPLLSVLLGCALLLRQAWQFIGRKQSTWPALTGPALSLIDMVLLVAGGFVVISAIGVPLLAAPLVRTLTAGLASPRSEAVGVVIQYAVMALPSVLILRRQLRALPSDAAPAGGWLQWQLRPPGTALRRALAGWLMVTPAVMVTGWLLVQLVGDPGGSNPLLELVLSSHDALALALLAFTAVVLAPLFEETIFRGALLPVLADRLGTTGGVLLSALLFGLAHISIGELAPLTVLGVGLAMLRLSSGRLLPCVLMHALWNAVTFFNLLLL